MTNFLTGMGISVSIAGLLLWLSPLSTDHNIQPPLYRQKTKFGWIFTDSKNHFCGYEIDPDHSTRFCSDEGHEYKLKDAQ